METVTLGRQWSKVASIAFPVILECTRFWRHTDELLYNDSCGTAAAHCGTGAALTMSAEVMSSVEP